MKAWTGVNSWTFPILAIYDYTRLIKELDFLKETGIKNIRVIANNSASHFMFCLRNKNYCYEHAVGEYNEAMFKGMDILLNELFIRGMTATIVLNNFWPWNGGVIKYLMKSNNIFIDLILYDATISHCYFYMMKTNMHFYIDDTAQDLWLDFVKQFTKRTNSVNGSKYGEDKTIFSWQLCNEPRLNPIDDLNLPFYRKKYIEWIYKSIGVIRQTASQFISLGDEGIFSFDYDYQFYRDVISIPELDYITLHCWVKNWGWGDDVYSKETVFRVADYLDIHLEIANGMNKKIVFEEFGFARDNTSYSPESTTVNRDKFFEFILKNYGSAFMGINFWTWGGHGKPKHNHLYDDKYLIGDNPAERQGWYSIFSTDKSTLDLIRGYND